MLKANSLRKDLKKYADSGKAEILQRFFKTKKGEYGQGDIFLGVAVPLQRKTAKKYMGLPLSEIVKLLQDRIHECRFSALILLIERYKKGDGKTKSEIVKIYFKNLKYINNWDLVDISAPHILADFLLEKNKQDKIKKMARSQNLWERRVAMVSTLTLIKKNDFKLTFELAKYFLKGNHHLMHKATGWMLREMGKRDKAVLKYFLEMYAKKMPRIMLSYSMERLNKKEKSRYVLVNRDSRLA